MKKIGQSKIILVAVVVLAVLIIIAFIRVALPYFDPGPHTTRQSSQ